VWFIGSDASKECQEYGLEEMICWLSQWFNSLLARHIKGNRMRREARERR